MSTLVAKKDFLVGGPSVRTRMIVFMVLMGGLVAAGLAIFCALIAVAVAIGVTVSKSRR
jgi:hypothetical protein